MTNVNQLTVPGLVLIASKESRPKGLGFSLPAGRGLSMPLLCSTYYSLKLLQAEPIISDPAHRRSRVSLRGRTSFSTMKQTPCIAEVTHQIPNN